MSSGVLLLAPGAVAFAAVAPAVGAVAVTVAAVAGVAIVATGAAVLVTRAASASAEALAGALVRLDESLRDAELRQVAAECAAVEAEARWQDAAEAAVQVNAQLRVLRAAARRAGLGPESDSGLPPPVSLAGRTLTEVLADCHQATAKVDAAKRCLQAKRLLSAEQLLDASVPADRADAARTHLDWVERAWYPAPEARSAVPAAGPAVGGQNVQAAIQQWLERLDPDAEPKDLEQVLKAADQASRTPELWLIQLGNTVKRINARLDNARRQSQEAAAYLEGLAAGGADPDGDPTLGPVVQRLKLVLAGETDLTESLRSDARWLVTERERAAAARHLTERLRALLEQEGFDVRAEFGSVAEPYDLLRVTRPGRHDHSGEVLVSGSRISHAAVTYRRPQDEDQRRADAEWCAALTGVMDRLRSDLAEAGVEASVSEASSVVRVEEREAPPRRADAGPMRRQRSR